MECDSWKYVGIADIPEEWACCEGGKMPNHYDYYKVKFGVDNITICLRCIYKWKQFDFDPNLDYRLVEKKSESEEKKEVHKGSRAIQTITEEVEMFQKTEDGTVIFEDLQKKFLEDHVKPNISFTEAKFPTFSPTPEDIENRIYIETGGPDFMS